MYNTRSTLDTLHTGTWVVPVVSHRGIVNGRYLVVAHYIYYMSIEKSHRVMTGRAPLFCYLHILAGRQASSAKVDKGGKLGDVETCIHDVCQDICFVQHLK